MATLSVSYKLNLRHKTVVVVVQGMNVNDEDFVDQMVATSTHDATILHHRAKFLPDEGMECQSMAVSFAISVVNLLHLKAM